MIAGSRETRSRSGPSARAAARSPLHDAGFSLLELLVASFMSILIVGGMLLILDNLRDAHRDQQELIDAQQAARLALDQIQRDLQLAGVGIAWMLPPLPVVVPRADGGVAVRHNQGGATALLTADMASTSDPFTVDEVSAFVEGMVVAIYDGTGTLDMVTVTGVDASTNRLLHGATVSKAYTVAAGAVVSRVRTVSYELQPMIPPKLALLRREDDGPAQPVAGNVRSLTITYYNDATPPQVFSPATVADQLRIKVIEVTLEVETANVRLNTTEERSVTLTTRVTPRAVLLSS